MSRKLLVTATLVLVAVLGAGMVTAVAAAAASSVRRETPAEIWQIVHGRTHIPCGRASKVLARTARAESAAEARLAAHQTRLSAAEAALAKAAGNIRATKAADYHVRLLTRSIAILQRLEAAGTVRQQAITVYCQVHTHT